LASISVPLRKNQIEPAIEGRHDQISSSSHKAIKRIIIRREKPIDEVSKVESHHVMKHDPFFDDFKKLFEDIYVKFQVLNEKVFLFFFPFFFFLDFCKFKSIVFLLLYSSQVSDLHRQVFQP
jgi:hypothetical protein